MSAPLRRTPPPPSLGRAPSQAPPLLLISPWGAPEREAYHHCCLRRALGAGAGTSPVSLFAPLFLLRGASRGHANPPDAFAPLPVVRAVALRLITNHGRHLIVDKPARATSTSASKLPSRSGTPWSSPSQREGSRYLLHSSAVAEPVRSASLVADQPPVSLTDRDPSPSLPQAHLFLLSRFSPRPDHRTSLQ
jgi:hypothetical protein